MLLLYRQCTKKLGFPSFNKVYSLVLVDSLLLSVVDDVVGAVVSVLVFSSVEEDASLVSCDDEDDDEGRVILGTSIWIVEFELLLEELLEVLPWLEEDDEERLLDDVDLDTS